MTESYCEKLMTIAADQSGLPPDSVLAVLDAPQWEDASRVHDWRNQVASCIRELWGAMGTESRLVAFIAAQDQALDEDWDSRL
jgi:hypothetical protein